MWPFNCILLRMRENLILWTNDVRFFMINEYFRAKSHFEVKVGWHFFLTFQNYFADEKKAFSWSGLRVLPFMQIMFFEKKSQYFWITAVNIEKKKDFTFKEFTSLYEQHYRFGNWLIQVPLSLCQLYYAYTYWFIFHDTGWKHRRILSEI